MKNKFERIVKFDFPFDKRNPDPHKNYGIGALRFWMILKGKKGAVQALFGTRLYLKSVMREHRQDLDRFLDLDRNNPDFDCWDVGYHSKKKISYLTKQKCDILGECYYDGSSLRGNDDKLGEKLLTEGEEAIWKYLEDYYNAKFGVSTPELSVGSKPADNDKVNSGQA